MMIVAPLFCCLFLQSLTAEAIEHAQAGTAAEKQGKFDVAILEFRKVVELQPEVASGHANLGEAYFQHGDYPAAVPELERALQLNPNLMGSHQTLGVALLLEGNAEAALPHLEKNRTPDLLGLAYLETGRLGSAIMALKAALENRPADADLLYYFGTAAALSSRRTHDQLMHLNPGRPADGAAGDRAGSPPQDLLELEKALAGRPDDPGLLAAFSRAADQAAQQAFDRIVEIDPNSPRAHQVKADRLERSGRLPEAERELAESLRLNPYAPHVHVALGNLLVTERKWPAAAAQFRLESMLRPADADPAYRLGSVLLEQGQPGEAVENLSKADRLRPGSPQILYELGRAAFAAGDLPRAEAAWRQVLVSDGNGALAASAHIDLAMLYRRSGKPADADREMAAYNQLKKKEAR